MLCTKCVTIIIPHWGGNAESEYAIEQCVTSLEETAPKVKRIVVKNGSECKHPGDMRIEEQGQNRAVNAAVATVNTPWIMVTNDDMVYPPFWYDKLTSKLDNISCISPKLVEPRPGAPTFTTYFCGGAGGDFDKARFLDFARHHVDKGIRTGFNLPFLIKKDLWDLIGGYDINYDPWGSNGDSDLEYRIRLAGVQPRQHSDVPVYHFSQTSGTFSSENQAYWNKNWNYFIEKWGFPRTDNGIWEANFGMPEPPVRKYCPEWEDKYVE